MLTQEAKRRGWTEAHVKKEWVGLTDEERNEILGTYKPSWERHIAKLIEAKLKEKNT